MHNRGKPIMIRYKDYELGRLWAKIEKEKGLGICAYCPEVVFLSLSGTTIKSLAPLENLGSLSTFNLMNTAVNDFTPLRFVTSLQELDLGGTKIIDLTPLVNLFHLRSLMLYDTAVSDISQLSTLTNLRALNLYNTKVRELKPLQRLYNLQKLDLGHTMISDGSFLSGSMRDRFASLVRYL